MPTTEAELQLIRDALKLGCPECDGRTEHSISDNRRVATCCDCDEPHEINPETLQPI